MASFTQHLLLELRNRNPGLAEGQNGEDTIEELKDRVALLVGQKEVLQRKLGMARQQILTLSRQAHQNPCMRWGVQEGEVTQTAQTVPAHFALSFMNDYKGLTERLFTEPKPLRLRALELAIQSLREPFKQKEKELEYPFKDLHKQQVDGLRLTIKGNVDVIRLQKQLSNERTAHLVIKDNYTVLKEGQRSLKENQGTLLGKVGQLIEQLKQEKQKTLFLEGELHTATISMHSVAEVMKSS
ncbi:protein fantom-like [Clarias magur]|uniref:Protein fantom-like n=1 Tax=Clarias magur TaxID=1594786 RepID=A0A8J4URR5_CLAMG|nr:protein fantom-like [Clarias magur]